MKRDLSECNMAYELALNRIVQKDGCYQRHPFEDDVLHYFTHGIFQNRLLGQSVGPEGYHQSTQLWSHDEVMALPAL